MSSGITLTSAVRSNLLALQTISGQEATTQEALATGKKVNSALDNPINYFTAAALTARSNELSQLLDSMTNGVNTLQAASNGLTSITTTIQSMQATVTQARQDASWQANSYTLDTTALAAAGTNVKSIGFYGGATSGTVGVPINVDLNATETVAGGTFAGGTAAAAGTLTIQAADVNGGNSFTVAITAAETLANVVAGINQAAGTTLAAANGTNALTIADPGLANKITITDSSPTGATLTGIGIVNVAGTTTSAAVGGAVETVDQIVAAINGNSKLAGLIKATDNAGQLEIENLSTSLLTVTGYNAATAKIDGSGGTSTIGGNTTRANLVTQFNELKDQLDKTADDSTYNGINLLSGDQLKLYFNESSTSSLVIQSTNPTGINSANLGIAAATNAQFQNNNLLDTELQTLQTASTTVASQASAFGNNLSIVQNRQDFTTNMVNTLQTGASGLTLADTNLEGANMLALQTSQQLAIQALSLASQSNQAVLKLFG